MPANGTDDAVETINNDGLMNNAAAESKEAASTDSTQSSDGKGYSADYSQSEEDQSSDDTGSKRKPLEAATSVAGLRISDRKVISERADQEDNTTSDSLSSLENSKKHRSSRQRKRTLGHLTKHNNEALESDNTFGEFLKSLVGQGFLPQLNGMLATSSAHPMDPRIDLSKVQYVPEAEIGAHQNAANANFPVLTEENYLQLMDSVRPFFRVPGVPLSEPLLQKEQKENEESSSDPVSSEGFTSFFTTTHTGSSNDNTTHSADSSDSNKKHSDTKDKDNTHGSEQTKSKRKDEGEGESSGSSQKRVRIIETARSPRASRDDAGNGAELNDPGPIIDRVRFLAARANDSTASSSSNSEEHRQVISRLVTDISSSNRTDSAAGTSESAGNTGSASNQGSSGSGADGKGSSEEGKGSSEDIGKSRGDDAGGSDETPFEEKPYGSVVKPKMDSGHNQKMQSPQGDELREKLIHKKRKRIEMRREYEAQQHFESSESSGYNSESLFRPGKHIQMDHVLQVSNIPRLVIQALSPFLVVHANAAYSRLTGLDAHEVVGKSVNFLLALPESASDELERNAQLNHERPTTQNTPVEPGGPTEPAFAGRATSEMQHKDSGRFETVERLIVSCGFGHIQFINALAVNRHQMVGCNVSFLSQSIDDAKENQSEKDEGSKPTNALRNDVVDKQIIPCRTAIAPIVSSQIPAESIVPTDLDTKRRKQHHNGTSENVNAKSITLKDPPGQHRRQHPPHVITHYIIQLERLAAGGVKQLSVDDSISSNSTSVEARLVGLSKTALLQQKAAVGHPGALGDDEASGSTTNQEETMIAIA